MFLSFHLFIFTTIEFYLICHLSVLLRRNPHLPICHRQSSWCQSKMLKHNLCSRRCGPLPNHHCGRDSGSSGPTAKQLFKEIATGAYRFTQTQCSPSSSPLDHYLRKNDEEAESFTSKYGPNFLGPIALVAKALAVSSSVSLSILPPASPVALPIAPSVHAWSNEQGRLVSNDTNNSSDDDANATGNVSVNFKVLGHSDMLIFLCEGPIFSPYHSITVAPLHRCTYQNFCNGFDMVFASYFPSVGLFTPCTHFITAGQLVPVLCLNTTANLSLKQTHSYHSILQSHTARGYCTSTSFDSNFTCFISSIFWKPLQQGTCPVR